MRGERTHVARDDVLAAAQDAARVEAGERGGRASFRRRQSDERDARARERRRGPARLDRR